jgi:hypothetical protein
MRPEDQRAFQREQQRQADNARAAANARQQQQQRDNDAANREASRRQRQQYEDGLRLLPRIAGSNLTLVGFGFCPGFIKKRKFLIRGFKPPLIQCFSDAAFSRELRSTAQLSNLTGQRPSSSTGGPEATAILSTVPSQCRMTREFSETNSPAVSIKK